MTKDTLDLDLKLIEDDEILAKSEDRKMARAASKKAVRCARSAKDMLRESCQLLLM